MEMSLRGAVWVIAAGVLAAGVYLLREPLIQFSLALLLWLGVTGIADAVRERAPFIPRIVLLPLAVIVVVGLLVLLGMGIAGNVGDLAANADGYEDRLNAVVVEIYGLVGLQNMAPTITDLASRIDPRAFVGEVAAGVQTLASNLVFILIFLAFLFPAANRIPAKLDEIFADSEKRGYAAEVLKSIGVSMRRYLWVQTIVSAIITVLTFITLTLIGLDHALFWAFLIFFLNYIPTIGSIVAVALPTAFALVQFTSLTPILAVAFGVGIWQFVIGNFVQPRLTGSSLNLSAVVVLLALAIWGAVWGVAGAFLAAPMTVMLMIVLAQFRTTRWIAILLSENGKPAVYHPTVLKSEIG